MDKTEIEDFKSVLTDNGYAENDFTINEKDTTDWDSNTLVPIKGIVTVKRISTKKEKGYNSGHNTHWVADFEKDLTQGFYN